MNENKNRNRTNDENEIENQNNEWTDKDKEILSTIEEDAKKVEIPGGLTPQAVTERLKAEQYSKRKAGWRKVRPVIGGIVAAAACAAIIVSTGVTGQLSISSGNGGVVGNASGQDGKAGKGEVDEQADDPDGAIGQGGETGQGNGNGEATAGSGTGSYQASGEGDVVLKKNQAISENIVLAKSEADVYRCFDTISDAQGRMKLFSVKNKEAAAKNGAVLEEGTTTNKSIDMDMEETADTGNSTGGYSRTNVMEEGVDESDTVKTDGNYIYTCREKEVTIVDIRDKKMKKAGVIKPKMKKNEAIVEMYVDGSRLYIITNKEVRCMGVLSCGVEDVAINSGSMESGGEDEGKDKSAKKTDKGFTRLLTYDIEDPSNPKLAGTVKQDGVYTTSRKTGDHIYLFSGINTYYCRDMEDLLPEINKSKLPADCMYMAEGEVDQELLVTTVDTNEPGNTCDELAVMCDAYQVYMNQDSIYLYSTKYRDPEEDTDKDNKDKEVTDITDNNKSKKANQETGKDEKSKGQQSDMDSQQVYDLTREYTRIIRLSCENGRLNGESSVDVAGTIGDPFAIHGSEKGLEVLTTVYDDEDFEKNYNLLTLFDENLKQTAQLKGIAKGEEVYAARYLGNLVYFVTYHNTDPFFAVDLSDRKKPKMLGFTKLSGYSEYIHPFGKGLMLGIGYETDPESGDRKGVKVSMFDTSDPEHLKTLDSIVLKGYCYLGVENNYKAALVDVEKNIIGFYAYHIEGKDAYWVLSWEDGKLKKKAKMRDPEIKDEEGGDIRGLYAGTHIYTVNGFWEGDQYGKIAIDSYDMEKGYKKVDRIKY